jgi:exopolysaccharide biosynthesis protein
LTVPGSQFSVHGSSLGLTPLNRERRTVNCEPRTLMRWICACLCFLPATLLAEWRVLDRQPAEPAEGAPFRLKVTDGSKTAELLLIVARSNAFSFRVVSNDDGRYGSVEDAATAAEAVAGVNGGYFQPDGTPVGLLISDNRTVHKFETARLISGVFFVQDGKPGLVRSQRFGKLKNVSQAIQCGPFLLEKGRSPVGLNDDRTAPRTFVFMGNDSVWGLGICRSVTLAEMSQILALHDLVSHSSLSSALNLDGGSSTQFWGRKGEDAISSSALAVVADYLLLVRRAK